MELNGTHKFAVPPQAVWNALHDANVLKNSIPGAENVAWQGDAAFTMTGGVGPFKGTLTAQVVEQTPPSHMKFAVTRASANGTLTVDLASDGAGTMATYAANIEAGGALGPALAMAKPIISGQIGQFFSRLDSQLGG